MAARVQSKVGISGGPDITVTLDSAPAEGNVLVAFMACRENSPPSLPQTGWTAVPDAGGILPGALYVYYRVLGAAPASAYPFDVTGNNAVVCIVEYSGVSGVLTDSAVLEAQGPPTATLSIGPATVDTDDSVAVVGWIAAGPGAMGGNTIPDIDPSGGYSLVHYSDTFGNTDPDTSLGTAPTLLVADRIVSADTTATASYELGAFANGDWGAVLLVFEAGTEAPVIVGELPQWEPPGPAVALLEIWTFAEDDARWDVATWGDDVWGEAGWRDITPQGVVVIIRWGSIDAEAGILADQAAADWDVRCYDPDRKLDPANEASPFHPELVPGLPIRISHRGVVIRTGQAESIAYRYATDTALIRASDAIAVMARADVPEDTVLADLMKERARDAIAAAGLSIPTPSNPNDYSIPAQPDGAQRVWWWVKEAARDRHVIPYIDQHNQLRWRAYSTPLQRGRVLGADELVDLQVVTEYSDLYSEVSVIDDDGMTEVVRAFTPTPAYGTRRWTRTIPTTDADGWAAAVLADRVDASLRWRPGDIRPLTANSVESLATLEVNEEIELVVPGIVNVETRVLGGRLRVEWRTGDAPVWTFALSTTGAGGIGLVDDVFGEPLVADQDTSSYLEAD